MVQPINTAWKCCETCDYWGGCRRFTSLGLVAQHGPREHTCSIKAASSGQDVYLCASYRRWRDLENLSAVPERQGSAR